MGPVGRQKNREQLSLECRAAYLMHGAKLLANFLSSYKTGLNRYQTLFVLHSSVHLVLFERPGMGSFDKKYPGPGHMGVKFSIRQGEVRRVKFLTKYV